MQNDRKSKMFLLGRKNSSHCRRLDQSVEEESEDEKKNAIGFSVNTDYFFYESRKEDAQKYDSENPESTIGDRFGQKVDECNPTNCCQGESIQKLVPFFTF